MFATSLSREQKVPMKSRTVHSTKGAEQITWKRTYVSLRMILHLSPTIISPTLLFPIVEGNQ